MKKHRPLRRVRSARGSERRPRGRLVPSPDAQMFVLRLFVTGSSPRSRSAIATIRSICDEYLPGNYELEVVDIYQQPQAAVGEQIVAAPTLVKQKPEPVRRMIGTLADRQRVLRGLDIITGVPGDEAPASGGEYGA